MINIKRVFKENSIKEKMFFNYENSIQNKVFNNIMFIGDPHIMSKNISKRNDDIQLMDVILDKLSQCAKISHEKKAYPIILGDLFNSNNENNIELMTKLVNVLNSFYEIPITLIGNHEKTETTIVDSDMLKTLNDSGVIDVINENELFGMISITDENNNVEQVEFGGTPYGMKIPQKVKAKSKKTESVIWVTHHDLMFKDYYPGSTPLHSIDGVCIAVNGHMHKTQPQIQIGNTYWYCTGNILRMSTDCDEHIPSVWLWNPIYHNNNYDKLIQIPLNYKKDIFNKPKKFEATEVLDFNFKNTNEKLNFIKQMEFSEQDDEENKTDDKQIVRECLENLGEVYNLPKTIRDELSDLLSNINDD